jgi:hypothetical protein
MFGSSLPVCAIQFPTIPELVKHGYNGLIFNNALELTNQFERLLFSDKNKIINKIDQLNKKMVSKNVEFEGDELSTFRRGVELSTLRRGGELSTLRRGAGLIESWDDNWDIVMHPVIETWLDL